MNLTNAQRISEHRRFYLCSFSCVIVWAISSVGIYFGIEEGWRTLGMFALVSFFEAFFLVPVCLTFYVIISKPSFRKSGILQIGRHVFLGGALGVVSGLFQFSLSIKSGEFVPDMAFVSSQGLSLAVLYSLFNALGFFKSYAARVVNGPSGLAQKRESPHTPLDSGVSKIEMIGVQPSIEGEVFQRLLVVQTWYQGELSEPATTIHFLVKGNWHCFLIDCGVFFWRSDRGEPQAGIVPEIETEWKVVDLGDICDLQGLILESIQLSASSTGGTGKFTFEGGRILSIIDENDCTRYVTRLASD